VLPVSVVYDPDLTASLPVDLSVISGLNAVAHAAEGLYAPDVSPIVALMAEEGARSMVTALPRIAADPADPAARADALRGAWLCGAVLGPTTMSLHHKLCHVLGGTFNLPHTQVHTVILPHALAFTLPAAPAAAAAWVGRSAPPGATCPTLQTLAADLAAPTDLTSHADRRPGRGGPAGAGHALRQPPTGHRRRRPGPAGPGDGGGATRLTGLFLPCPSRDVGAPRCIGRRRRILRSVDRKFLLRIDRWEEGAGDSPAPQLSGRATSDGHPT